VDIILIVLTDIAEGNIISGEAHASVAVCAIKLNIIKLREALKVLIEGVAQHISARDIRQAAEVVALRVDRTLTNDVEGKPQSLGLFLGEFDSHITHFLFFCIYNISHFSLLVNTYLKIFTQFAKKSSF
jgi:hypothetical protein